MSLWLFRRRSRRKRSPTAPSDTGGRDRPRRSAEMSRPNRRQTAPAANAAAHDTLNQHTDSSKLHRRRRTYSFSPDRGDDIGVKRKSGRRFNRGSSPQNKVRNGTSLAARVQKDAALEKEQDADGALREDVFDRAPTLHNRRDGKTSVSRKRSSRTRRRDERQREAEIKAMADFMPVRPATEEWGAGRPMRKESRRVRSGFSFGLGRSSKTEWDKENRSSEVSLPIPESIHSSLSTDSDRVAYQVTTFSALAPRPRLSYSVTPRWSHQASAEDGGLQQSQSLKRKISITGPIPESTLKAHKRVDDLANDLNASDLRELMERDQRRRDRKQQRDQEKATRRLARRAEKQKGEEAAAARDGRSSPPNLERGVLGREAVGLGIDTTSAVVTSSMPRSLEDDSSEHSEEKRKVVDGADLEKPPRNPLAEFRRTDSADAKETTPSIEPTPQTPQTPPISSTLKARRSLRAKLTRSRPSQASERKSTQPGAQRNASESNPGRKISWSFLLRWAKRPRRASEPSSFSNTSRDSMRESMLFNQQPAIPANFAIPVRKPSVSGVPKRTMSRFREDLPELPRSPSRRHNQGAEMDAIPPTIAETSPDLGQADQSASSPMESVIRHDSPTSGHYSSEPARQTPTSWTHIDAVNPSPEPHAMSLASIDSEGSWLSGGMGSRSRSSRLRESMTRHRQTPSDIAGTSERPDSAGTEHASTREDQIVPDDEHVSSAASTPTADAGLNHTSSGEASPSHDDNEAAKWGTVKGQRPSITQGNRMQSREGLVRAWAEEDEHSPTAAAHGGDSDDGSTSLQRAKSINLSKAHARHISAGSAKLLDITPRSSVEGKRRSVGLRESS